MNNPEVIDLKRKIKWLIGIFIFFLVISGLTAFPLETELSILNSLSANAPETFKNWIATVYEALKVTNDRYPFMAYGTDWLAFAHIIIAIFFIGPYIDPVKNIWILKSGMIACVLVIPLALICGPIRQIPFYWQLIDCSFGVIGFVPLYVCYRYILRLEGLVRVSEYRQ